jgi:hypothetical protein
LVIGRLLELELPFMTGVLGVFGDRESEEFGRVLSSLLLSKGFRLVSFNFRC